MAPKIIWHDKWTISIIVIVLTVLVQATHAQSYLLTLGQSQRNFLSEYDSRSISSSEEQRTNSTITSYIINSNEESEEDNGGDDDDSNSTVIVVKKVVRERPTELSQTAMDIITIVWYVATFLALAAFFLLMACSDRRCSDTQRNANGGANSNETVPPPTPSPSYSEFAPPSYETVMKMQHAAKTTIFVIPFGYEENNSGRNKNNNDNTLNSNGSDANGNEPQTPTTPAVNFYTIDELHKLGGS